MRHGIDKKPIHNVKEGANPPTIATANGGETDVFISGNSRRSRIAGMKEVVEPSGIEPLTPCLQSRCSPS